MTSFITPVWPAPTNIKALTTTRQGGFSKNPFNGFNLAEHVNDDPLAVLANRQQLKSQMSLPQEPVWLHQVHSTTVVNIDNHSNQDPITADASYATKSNIVCCVMTADCLPILICDKNAHFVMAIHAGWRGLVDGIIENALNQMSMSPDDILVWLGPAIGANVYEVGNEVLELFLQQDKTYATGFLPSARAGHWFMDIYHLARLRFRLLGISNIFGGQYCTYQNSELFYSYRRDGVTGRMASLIWISA